MNEPLATIVVTPRERYSTTERCLATLVANTPTPHHLICVLGAAPRYVEELAEEVCNRHSYELLSRPELLSPNAARNVGLERVGTRYVVFVDNDVVVAPGWLDALIACAEETGADIVGPLCLVGEPEDGVGHSSGGTVDLVERDGHREIAERHLVNNLFLNVESVALERTQCDFAEFHGMLVRRDLFDRVGVLDEGVLSVAEHIDLAFQVKKIGGTTWSEPASVISYLSSAVDYTLGDVDLFTVRWSDDWSERGLDHLCEKWGIARDSQYVNELALYARFLRARVQAPDVGTAPGGRDPASHPYAQTNVQLFSQLLADDAPSYDLEKIRAAVDTAAILFAGRFRPSGKPFLAHLIGTASVLASYGWHPPVVTAGLLHAAYDAGGFPESVTDDYEAQRRWLRRRVGRLTEAIVHEYSHLDPEGIERTIGADDLDRLPLHVAYAIVLRIANTIEEHADGGSAYWDSDEVRELRARDDGVWAPLLAAIAPRVGAVEMLERSRDLREHVGCAHVPAELRYHGASNFRITDSGATEILTRPTRPTRGPIPGRDLAEFIAPPGPPPLRDRVARLPKRALTALEGGRVTSRRRTWLLECDPRQWAYSASAELGDLGGRGSGVLRLRLVIDSGELGIGVLVPDSWTDFVIPEWSHGPTGDALEVVLPLPAIEEAGRLVFRSWAATGVHTRACVHAAEIFRVESRAG